MSAGYVARKAVHKSIIIVLLLFLIPLDSGPFSSADPQHVKALENKVVLQSYGTYVFPDSSLCGIENSSSLAENLSFGLGLPSPQPASLAGGFILSPASLYLLDREDASLDPNPYLFVVDKYPELVYKAMSYSCGEANLTLCYDNLGSIGNVFMAFSIDFGTSGPIGVDITQYSSIAWSMVDELHIPHGNLTVASYNSSFFTVAPMTNIGYDPDWSNNNTITWYNRTTIVMQMSLSDYDLGGCNQLGFLFNDDARQLVAAQCAAFVSLPENVLVSPENALDVGRSEIPSSFYHQSTDMLIADEIVGIRLFVVTNTPETSQNYSGLIGVDDARFLRFAYVYVAQVAIDKYSGYFSYVIVDLESGTGLYSMRSPPWVVSRDSSGAIVRTVAIWSPLAIALLFVVAVFVGPMEFSFFFLGSLVIPALLRFRGLEVLDNFNRGRIYGYIRGRPGCTFSELKEEIHVLNGTLAYHLAILERVGVIRSTKSGQNRRYFTGESGIRIRSETLLGKTESLVLSTLCKGGSLSTTEIAKALRISRQRAHYNLRHLMRRGLIKETPSGWISTELDDEGTIIG